MSDSEAPELEHSWFAGLIFSSVLYGILFWITFQSVYLLVKSRSEGSRRVQMFYIVYSLTIFAFMTADKTCNLILAERMWIDHRLSEGGPLGYFSVHLQEWYNIFGSATSMFVNFLGDGLLLYRLYIIYNSTIPVMIIPTLIYTVSTIMAIISAVQSGDTGGFLARQATNFGVPWIALTSAFNIIVTALIAGRLLWARNQMRAFLGDEGTAVYTGVVAILVESALPFSLVGIIFAVLLGKDHPVELFFSSVWGTLAAISPMLIILRVSMGRAWSRDTMSLTQVSTRIDFSHGGSTTAHAAGSQNHDQTSRTATGSKTAAESTTEDHGDGMHFNLEKPRKDSRATRSTMEEKEEV